jgi:hypothetical protein
MSTRRRNDVVVAALYAISHMMRWFFGEAVNVANVAPLVQAASVAPLVKVLA